MRGPTPTPRVAGGCETHRLRLCRSTGIMICNSTGPVNAQWAAPWGLVDIDWNSDKVDWSKAQPMVSASAARDAGHRAALRWCRRPPSLPSVRHRAEQRGEHAGKRASDPRGQPGRHHVGLQVSARRAGGRRRDHDDDGGALHWMTDAIAAAAAVIVISSGTTSGGDARGCCGLEWQNTHSLPLASSLRTQERHQSAAVVHDRPREAGGCVVVRVAGLGWVDCVTGRQWHPGAQLAREIAGPLCALHPCCPVAVAAGGAALQTPRTGAISCRWPTAAMRPGASPTAGAGPTRRRTCTTTSSRRPRATAGTVSSAAR